MTDEKVTAAEEAAEEEIEFDPYAVEQSEDDGTKREDGLNAEDKVEAK